MLRVLRRIVFVAVVAIAIPAMARAGDLKLTMQNGRVSISADNVPVRQILQEWARIGQTRIVNLERVNGPNVTLQLVDMPERDALDILLRSVTGYIAAPRATPLASAATYDRITIFVSTTRPPAQVVSATPQMPAFQRPIQNVDDSDEPINVAMPPQMAPQNPALQQFPGAPPGGPVTPAQLQQQMQQQMQQLQQQLQPAPQVPATSPVPGPLTAPRPGMIVPPVQVKPGGGGS